MHDRSFGSKVMGLPFTCSNTARSTEQSDRLLAKLLWTMPVGRNQGACIYRAAWAYIDGKLVRDAWIELDDTGSIRAIASEHEPCQRLTESASVLRCVDLGHVLLVPGFVNAHSHGFQRALRGRAQRHGLHTPSSFWSWRTRMYELANSLDPDAFQRVTTLAYRDMLRSGVTCVGEFHYLHHQPDGRPYSDPDELSVRVAEAAREVGIRLCLLEVYYARSAFDRPLEREQRRFADGTVERLLARVERLRGRGLQLGIAPHSVRAVPAQDIRVLAEYAHQHALPLHMHVAEQAQELESCVAEHGVTPVELLERLGCFSQPHVFTAVHAIRVSDSDILRLAEQTVCACPTTEADLGDGIVPAVELARAGVTLALGSDSNAIVDLVQESRLLEMHTRLDKRERLCLRATDGSVATTLLDAMTNGGARALRRPDLGSLRVGAPFDAVSVDLEHPTLEGLDGHEALDAWLLAGTAAPLSKVFIGGSLRLG